MTGAAVQYPFDLGILAGGQASRLGGADKAWLRRDGIAQVQRLAAAFPGARVVLVSANRQLGRYAARGLEAVADRVAGAGPLAGLDALVRACSGDWLLTMPVDVVDVPDGLAQRLAAAGERGAYLVDDDGPQPLAALWRLAPLRPELAAAMASGQLAVHALQRRLGMAPLRLVGVRLGNLNTPADLAAAGVEPP
ncbi:molybdenum cofactor guanylyltransferase [Luteimonas sp. SJ-92]|uniref:Molybdenum cofactor guanylyltransferase n=2 Tax=Luteimonas salinisoli TaxID=2752307 RepID=A0A853JHU9_9GAMM|nr:molybdenum cofactor guanylyltransferase [Luteimonas salinisoli]NZA28000.1 molybdenum cofactor guanylyltransferase [Luteimonas salinisoli]